MLNPFFAFRTHSQLISCFIRQVFPLIDQEVNSWQNYALRHMSGELQTQALASIRDKKFHCQGGCIYSLYPGVDPPAFVRLVVALQTISDYLDNLCDRAGIADEAAFRQLHLAMTDALDPLAERHDYYQYYQYQQDGGYLQNLVAVCQEHVARLPGYAAVKPEALRLATLYSELQTYKHLQHDIREAKMYSWINPHQAQYPEITPWEFAAATGSTLGMFALCAAASSAALTAAAALRLSQAYFPWISGLHILLDYFIDEAEDAAGGDLNFVTYYPSRAQMLHRLTHFTQQAFMMARSLPEPLFHETIVHGLLALYLSDPKANTSAARPTARALLNAGTWKTKLIYQICRLLRYKKNL